MDHASAVIISGRNATGLPDDFCARLTVAAKKNGLPVAVDTSGPALRASIAAEPTVIKPNAAETAELLGIPVDARKPKTIETALRTLRERGIPYPIISVGKDGAFTLDGSQIICVRPPSLGIVTTVGCGDSLLAGFMASYVHKKPIACALREATAWAAANTQSTVHGKIDRAAVARLRKHCIVTFLH
jgi:fructose-1-phosphate kinase PfkB-like protein